MVRKNTLPYVYQWTILDTDTGKKIGEYKSEKLARASCEYFEKYGHSNGDTDISLNTETPLDGLIKRMGRPNSDQLPKPPRHSRNRPVELD